MIRIITAEEAAALFEGSTPGVWTDFGDTEPYPGHVVATTGDHVVTICRDPEMDDRPGDRALIAAAPDLAYTVVELEKERDRLHRMLNRCVELARANVASLSNDQTEVEAVALLSEHCVTAMDERDRLQDILDCETGKRAPGRWRWEDGEWYCGTLAVVRRPTGMGWFWGRTDRGTFYAETCHDHALEAIEAADRAAKENG